MTDTLILKAPKAVPTPKPKAEGSAAKKIPVWPDVFDAHKAKELFTGVDDLVTLMAYYTLWRLAETGKGDTSQVAACKALIEHRQGRACVKSPMSGELIDEVTVTYIEPEDLEEGGQEDA
jgi:hypothetical protein